MKRFEIIAELRDGQKARYTSEILPLMVGDPFVVTIIDAETGELIHDSEDPTIYLEWSARARIGSRSAWGRGVGYYVGMLCDGLRDAINGGWFDADDLKAPKILRKALLNGAADWAEYSWGGCAFIYDGDIAKTLCNPSELKETDSGRKAPNARETWLDVQARALYQAAEAIVAAATVGA